MKTTAAFLSKSTSGSFAASLVASNWRGKAYVQITHKPGGRPTNKQLVVRDRFFIAKEIWKTLDYSEQQAYRNRAKDLPMTGYNLFIMEFQAGYGQAFYGRAYFGI